MRDLQIPNMEDIPKLAAVRDYESIKLAAFYDELEKIQVELDKAAAAPAVGKALGSIWQAGSKAAQGATKGASPFMARLRRMWDVAGKKTLGRIGETPISYAQAAKGVGVGALGLGAGYGGYRALSG